MIFVGVTSVCTTADAGSYLELFSLAGSSHGISASSLYVFESLPTPFLQPTPFAIAAELQQWIRAARHV